uniref:Uncharacterized protein n=1 Tax=Lutzomyia longipalpis TaxID=7200 RepID=A0A1B0GKC4_LUTLO
MIIYQFTVEILGVIAHHRTHWESRVPFAIQGHGGGKNGWKKLVERKNIFACWEAESGFRKIHFDGESSTRTYVSVHVSDDDRIQHDHRYRLRASFDGLSDALAISYHPPVHPSVDQSRCRDLDSPPKIHPSYHLANFPLASQLPDLPIDAHSFSTLHPLRMNHQCDSLHQIPLTCSFHCAPIHFAMVADWTERDPFDDHTFYLCPDPFHAPTRDLCASVRIHIVHG